MSVKGIKRKRKSLNVNVKQRLDWILKNILKVEQCFTTIRTYNFFINIVCSINIFLITSEIHVDDTKHL